MKTLQGATALATLVLLLPFAAAQATTPAPKAAAKRPIAVPTPHLSKVKLHTEFVVEVNKLGQIVRVKSGKSCPNLTFNAQTYGNVLQMWIRHPDGTAEAGLYRVTYDYDPHAAKITRRESLIRPGGDWSDKRGAANDMTDEAQQENARAQQQQNQQHFNLPSLNKIVKPTPKPTPHS